MRPLKFASRIGGDLVARKDDNFWRKKIQGQEIADNFRRFLEREISDFMDLFIFRTSFSELRNPNSK